MKENINEKDTEEVVKNEEVTVSKEWLENLVSRVETLEGKPKKLKQINDHFAFIRLYENKIVNGVKKFWHEKANSTLNDLDERRMFAELDIKDGVKNIKVDWLNFLNDGSNKVKVKIVSQTAHEKPESHGVIMANNLDEHFNKGFNKEEAQS